MKEEDKLIQKTGKKNPFSVPDGYFDNLTPEIMNRLPEAKKTEFTTKEVKIWDRVKPWIYMAAMFIGAALIIRVASPGQKESVSGNTANIIFAGAETISDEDIETVLDLSMMDDYSLYSYITEAGAE